MNLKNFSVFLPYNDKIFQVRFNEIYAPQNKYFIEINCDNQIVTSFEMALNYANRWTILHPAPNWVNDIEKLLVFAITENTPRFNGIQQM